MEILILLIIISVGIAAGFLIAFLLSVKNRQYDDLYSPSVRILFEKNKIDDKDDRVDDIKRIKTLKSKNEI